MSFFKTQKKKEEKTTQKQDFALYAAPEGSVGGAAGDGSMRSWVPPHRVHREAVTPRHLHLHHVIVAQPAAGNGGGGGVVS